MNEADKALIMERLTSFLGTEKQRDGKQWARDIIDAYVDHRPLTYQDGSEVRELTGKPISVWQLQVACGALGLDVEKIIRDSRTTGVCDV